MKKRILSVLLAAAMIVSLFAAAAVAEDKTYTIRVMSWHGAESPTKIYNGYKQIADNYMATHPNVKIEFVFQPMDGYKELLDTQFISGSAPEVIHMQPWMTKEYANKEQLLDLTNAFNAPSAYAPDAERWIDTFELGEASFSRTKADNKFGGIFFVPNDGNPRLAVGQPMLYNKNLFAQAGLDPEKTPANWKEYMDICQALLDAGIPPIASDNERFMSWSLGQVQTSFGEKYVNQFFDEKYNVEGSSDLFWDKVYISLANGALRDAPYYDDLLNTWKTYAKYWQQGWPGITWPDAKTSVVLGTVAMQQIGTWDIDSYTAEIGDSFEWGVFPIPVVDKETSEYASGLSHAASNQQDYGFSINKSIAQDPGLEAAVIDFMQFLTSKEQQEEYVHIASSFSPVVGVSIPEALAGFVSPVELSIATEVVGCPIVDWSDGATWGPLAQDYLTDRMDLATFKTKVADASAKASQDYLDKMLAPEGFAAQITAAEAKLEELKAEGAAEVVVNSQQAAVDMLKLRDEMVKQYYAK